MTGLFSSSQRHFCATPIRRHLWRALYKSSPSNCNQYWRSSARCHRGLLPIQPPASLPTSALSGNRWHLSLRLLGSAAPSDDNIPPPHSSPSKQIQVWEQTISSSNANTSSDPKDADGKEVQSSKGRVLYRPVRIHGENSNNVGWEVVTPKAATDKDANANPLSSISSSSINSYKSKGLTNIQDLPFIHHFLPARYPHSVCPSYAQYASYCFLGSIAGSAAMVLSTQALLVAVGVGTQSAAPMAAALNWVMKDGVGQLGGVIFASQLGKGGIDLDSWRGKFGRLTGSSVSGDNKSHKKRGNFQRGTADSNPKRWRMVAALALDLSTLLEICTPMMGPEWFLPCASIANIGKNVGFLAASASRAAIHQSLSQAGSSIVAVDTTASPEETKTAKSGKNSATTAAKSSNLGDVTAKSGSQAIVASLLGTAIGIGLSRTFCSDYGTAGILAGFVVLSAIHQVCTYKAVKVVPLRSLDRHRLHIVLSSYLAENYSKINTHDSQHIGKDNHASIDQNSGRDAKVLSPAQVAEKESFLPMMPPDDSASWLSVGSPLINICPSGVAELEQLLLPKKSAHDECFNNSINPDNLDALDSKQCEKYILKVHPPKITTANSDSMVQLTFLEGATDEDLLRGMFHAYAAHAFLKNRDTNENPHDGDNGYPQRQILLDTHTIMSTQIPTFIEHLRVADWQIGTGFVNVECGSSYRLNIQSV